MRIAVTIALNPCNPDTGMYLLLRGSHHEKHPSLIPVKEWDNSIISLDAGDALIWRGDLFYFLSPRIGGRWLTLSKFYLLRIFNRISRESGGEKREADFPNSQRLGGVRVQVV